MRQPYVGDGNSKVIMFGAPKDYELEARFKSKFEREMTPEEAKYLSLAEVALGEEGKSIHLVENNEAA